MPQRQCGPCTACCVALPVKELAKPQQSPCRYLCATGCAIYRQPQTLQICTEFECEWLRGYVPEDCRPDQLGVMFWLGKQIPIKDGILYSVLRINELRSGALSTNRPRIDTIVQQIEQRLSQQGHHEFAVIEMPYETPGTGLPGDDYEDQLERVDGKYVLRRFYCRDLRFDALFQGLSPEFMAQICGPPIIVTPSASATA
jgi:hypothetical protein